LLLARAGGRVLLVDRSTFPSDSAGGHAIKLPGVAYLQRWGLLDAVLATGCPSIREMQVAVGEHILPLPDVGPDSLPVIAPRRTYLDLTLVRAATAAGVDVLEATPVTRVLRDGASAYGVEVQGRDGRSYRALAPVVIGADGKNSFVAREVGAIYEHYQPPVAISYCSYWSGSAIERMALHLAPGRAAGVAPTNDGLVMVFVQARWSERHAFRADPSRRYLETLHSFPRLAVGLAGATHEGPLRGMIDQPAFFRRSYGPGWALAGDAAHHQDPITARGISDAFRDADLLARAVSSALGGETDLVPALRRYQQEREAASRHVSTLNHRLAELPDGEEEIERRLVELLTAERAVDVGDRGSSGGTCCSSSCFRR
jgi:2-polyprenyl-6-methoxyphenol hydroxylase-like FAD-dependent oxidoreductase